MYIRGLAPPNGGVHRVLPIPLRKQRDVYIGAGGVFIVYLHYYVRSHTFTVLKQIKFTACLLKHRSDNGVNTPT